MASNHQSNTNQQLLYPPVDEQSPSTTAVQEAQDFHVEIPAHTMAIISIHQQSGGINAASLPDFKAYIPAAHPPLVHIELESFPDHGPWTTTSIYYGGAYLHIRMNEGATFTLGSNQTQQATIPLNGVLASPAGEEPPVWGSPQDGWLIEVLGGNFVYPSPPANRGHTLTDVLSFVQSLPEVQLSELDEESRECAICRGLYVSTSQTLSSLEHANTRSGVRL